MILNHIWGIYTQPKQEWKAINTQHESYFSALSHILIIALIPAGMAYYASAHLGWNIGAGVTADTIRLTSNSAMAMSVAMYFGLIIGVIALAILIYELAKAGRTDEAIAIYRWFLPLLELDINTKLVQNIKLAEVATGIGSEHVRAPRLPLIGEERANVLQIIEDGLKSRPTLPEYKQLQTANA